MTLYLLITFGFGGLMFHPFRNLNSVCETEKSMEGIRMILKIHAPEEECELPYPELGEGISVKKIKCESAERPPIWTERPAG